MSSPRLEPRRKWKRRIALAIALVVCSVAPAGAARNQLLSVGDPIEQELRLLDLFPRAELHDRLRLPHLGLRPLRLSELQGPGAPSAGARPEVTRSMARIERVLGRDTSATFAPDPLHPATPRFYQREAADDQLIEASLAIEGGAASRKVDAGSAFVSGSGAHARLAIGIGGWLAYSHLVLGRFAGARAYADPVIANSDVVIHSEETYLTYTPNAGRWALSLGRNRWHWGPGEEASLVLSRTSAPMTGLSFSGGMESLHLQGTVLNLTLDQAAGEQLAAHRIEWQPWESLRLGVTEAARYRASSWQPLYLTGVLPYVMVQRLLVQDAPESSAVLRNNILTGFDAAWRVAPGTRIYGELAVDDLHSKTSRNPDKIAWQLGWEGAGMISGQRLSWGGEVTRVWRYVYTSFFGRAYEAQDRPIGFPTGPDARRVRLRVAWDPSVDWQLFAHSAQTDKGENDLDEPFEPGSPKPDPGRFEGIVERTREAELGLRWWPAGGVDVTLSGGWRKVRDADHVRGATRRETTANLALRLTH